MGGGGGSECDVVRAAAFSCSFFFFFIPKAMSMWSQSRPPRNNAADPRADTFTVGEVGTGGRVEGVHHRELGKSHVREMMIQLMAA